MNAWQKDVQSVQDESGGALYIYVVQTEDVPELLGDALTGNSLAGYLLRAVAETLERVKSAPRRQPPLCASCPRRLRKGVAYSTVAVFPACDDPTKMLALAVCTTCATEPDAIKEKARQGLQRIWPDLRHVEITHPVEERVQ